MFFAQDLLANANPPVHWQTQFAGQELDYIPGDSIEDFEKHVQQQQKLDYLQSQDWLLPGCFTYKFNSSGFRSMEPELNSSSIVGLGCSHTMGVGLPPEAVWIAQLGKRLDCTVYNLGVAGSSLDTAFRIALYWLPIIKPKYVVLNCPEYERFEFRSQPTDEISLTPGIAEWFTEEEKIITKRWWLNDENSIHNAIKNVYAIANICKSLDIDFYAYQPDEMPRKLDQARDFCHRGPACHESFAQMIYNDIRKENEQKS